MHHTRVRNIQLVILILLSILVPYQSFAQFTDDFSDKNFNQNPIWTGDENHFRVNDQGQLQLAATEAGLSSLLVVSEAIDNAIWEFYIKMDFNPSGSNCAKIYLTAESNKPETGYFVKIGGSNDEVSLFRQDGTEEIKIIDGEDGRTDKDLVALKVKATRNANGYWELFTQQEGEENFVSEGFTTDLNYVKSSFFVVQCHYTVTRTDKFYFDDFKVTGDPFEDDVPPVIETVQPISSTSLQVHFSEHLNELSAENVDHYSVNNHNPQTALLQSNGNTISLEFSDPFEQGKNYSLAVSNITDKSGNSMVNTTVNFIYYTVLPASFRDVVINEIFADPSPKVALPEIEFIELYNNSEKVFNLSGWQYGDATSVSELHKFLLLPKTYLILCPASDTAVFSAYGKVLGVGSWPTLNNGGDSLFLKDETEQTIDVVQYTTEWYKHKIKSEGGWSLEMIDPRNPCSGADNWKASINEAGGTPGQQNSVFAHKPDLTGPELSSLVALDSVHLLLYFNERLDTGSIKSANYKLDKEVGIIDVQIFLPDVTKVLLKLQPPLQKKELYTITVSKIRDCNGNPINSSHGSLQFALPEVADSMDLVINEVLFNPKPLGNDFVEIYNNSDKFINLKGWQLANMDMKLINGEITEVIDDRQVISEGNLVMAPKTYWALTEDAINLKANYTKGKVKNFLEITMPGYSDQSGTVVLLNQYSEIIDRFDYHEDMHYPLVKNEEGVSLERISFSAPTNKASNWKSAAGTEGFATPGYENSQAMPEGAVTGNISVFPKIFTPDNDGHHDYTTIQYEFENNGNMATITIYDPRGRKVRNLAENAYLATTGNFVWNGLNNDSQLARTGRYIIHIQLFNLNGQVQAYKKMVVLGHKF